MNINDAELGKFMELAGETGVKVFLLHGDNWREAVANLAALPASGNTLGDIRQTTDTGNLYRWNGTTWEIYDSNTGNILTTPTTADTAVSSEGGLMKNIDSAAGEISQTGNGYIEDEKFGVYQQVGTSGTKSSRFTSEITRTGKKVVYFNNQLTSSYFMINIDGTAGSASGAQDKLIPCKPSTKYRLWGYFYILQNTSSIQLGAKQVNSALANIGSGNGANIPVAAGWQYTEYEFTTLSTTEYIKPKIECSSSGAGNVEEGYFDLNGFKLDEITENTANSLTSSSPSLVSFTAVGSVDNIDQSQTDSTSVQPIDGDSTGTRLGYRFTPTKSKLTGISLYLAKIGSPTDNIVVQIQGNTAGFPNGTVYASYSILASTVSATKTAYTFPVPSNLIIGNDYHIVATRSGSTDAVNYINVYRTNTDNASGRGEIWNGSAWIFWARQIYFTELYYKPTTSFTARQNNVLLNITTDEDGFINGSTINLITGIASFIETFGTYYIHNYTVSGSDLIAKIKLPGASISGIFSSDKTLTYSTDNGVTYSSKFPVGYTNIYVKIASYSGITSFSYSILYNTSSIPTLYNYPTNKDIIQTYTRNLSSATTIALYRVNKYGFPAIEYSNGEYQYLDIDTTAVGSTVAFSSNGSSYTTVADGASIGLTSTTNPVVWVRSNITANRIFISSDDYNVSSNKRGSLKMGLVYQIKNQGLIYDVQDIQKEVNKLKTQYITGMTLITGDITTEAGSYIIVPTATTNINLIKVPKAGTKFSVIVRTSGTSSYTLTFNTGFKSTGTLATGTVDSKYFTVNFISDGIQAIETSRTTAM